MDKLISLDALINNLESFCGEQRYLISKEIWEIIKKQPTAFDKEKVIEELKQNTCDIHFTEDGSFNGKFIEDFEFIQAKTAIKIVKKGGVD